MNASPPIIDKAVSTLSQHLSHIDLLRLYDVLDGGHVDSFLLTLAKILHKQDPSTFDVAKS